MLNIYHNDVSDSILIAADSPSYLTLYQVQDLEEQLSERADAIADITARREQLERELADQEAAAGDLRNVIRHLEGEVEGKESVIKDLNKVRRKKYRGIKVQKNLYPLIIINMEKAIWMSNCLQMNLRL